jgi:hypothetical protein
MALCHVLISAGTHLLNAWGVNVIPCNLLRPLCRKEVICTLRNGVLDAEAIFAGWMVYALSSLLWCNNHRYYIL